MLQSWFISKKIKMPKHGFGLIVKPRNIDDLTKLSQIIFDVKSIAMIAFIGTPGVYYDSIAPCIGDNLNNANTHLRVTVLGNSENPIDAFNVREVSMLTGNSCVLAVDAAHGKWYERLGTVIYTPGSLKPGLAQGKALGTVGDYSLRILTSKDKLFSCKKKFISEKTFNQVVSSISYLLINCFKE